MPEVFELVDRNWRHVIGAAARDCGELRLICPFIKRNIAEQLIRIGRPSTIQVITRFNLSDFCAGVSDISALRLLLEAGGEVRGIRNLHAKIYLFGSKQAVVTSANLTQAALGRNHEFGFVASDESVIKTCRAYFDRLWSRAGDNLQKARIAHWESLVEAARSQGAGPLVRPRLPDEGADVGFEVPPDTPTFSNDAVGVAFVKFFGEGRRRADPSLGVIDQLHESGAHWACTYPKNRRPRGVTDGDVMFLAQMTHTPNDYRIFGRAIAMRYQEGRDDASPSDIRVRSWKDRWPHYIRIHSGQFIAGKLSNCVSLSNLMADLGADSFASTQSNARAGSGNRDPRRALRQQAAVRLSDRGMAWLQESFDRAIAIHGQLAAADLAELDWPALRVSPLSTEARALLKTIAARLRSGAIDPERPDTFMGYAETVSALGLQPITGRGVSSQLRAAGMDELNEWAKNNNLPAVTGFVVRKVNSRSMRPGNGYFSTNDKDSGDLRWWRDQCRAAAEVDWLQYIQ